VFRIDDYPTGVRPVVKDRFKKFSTVLDEFESRNTSYILGVVPALVDEDDIEYLLSLKFASIALHGYDHNFYCFDELKDNREEFKDSFTSEIYDSLSHGLSILKDFNIDTYIPPFNRYSQNLVDAVVRLGIKRITTGVNPDNNIDHRGLEVLTPKDIFYGRSTDIIDYMRYFNPNIDHVALHLTWEVDEYEKFGKNWYLPNVIKAYNDRQRFKSI